MGRCGWPEFLREPAEPKFTAKPNQLPGRPWHIDLNADAWNQERCHKQVALRKIKHKATTFNQAIKTETSIHWQKCGSDKEKDYRIARRRDLDTNSTSWVRTVKDLEYAKGRDISEYLSRVINLQPRKQKETHAPYANELRSSRW